MYMYGGIGLVVLIIVGVGGWWALTPDSNSEPVKPPI
jgi:hypothetical protein